LKTQTAYETTIDGWLVASKQSLFRQASSNLARNGHIGHEHVLSESRETIVNERNENKYELTYLLNQLVCLFAFKHGAVFWNTILVELEVDLDVVDTQRTILEPTLAQMTSNRLQYNEKISIHRAFFTGRASRDEHPQLAC
jgi:hypothetical protein